MKTPIPGPLTKEIASIIKGRMGRFSVNQAELAVHVGVDQSQLSKMVRGLKHIDIDQLEIMCAVLGIEIDKVVDEAALAVANRGEWPDVPALVVEGVRVSGHMDDEPNPISDAEETAARQSEHDLAARRGERK